MDTNVLVAHIDRQFSELRRDFRSASTQQADATQAVSQQVANLAQQIGSVGANEAAQDRRLDALDKRDSKGLALATSTATVIASVIAAVTGALGKGN